MEYVNLFSVFAVGLFAGSLLLEGMVLVPFWRTMDADSFFHFHGEFGPRLFGYFAPLTTIAVTLPVVNAMAGFLSKNGHDLWAWMAAGLLLVVAATFPLYFKAANQSFADRSLTNDALPTELSRWSKVHSFRTVLALLAFIMCLKSSGL
jgi:hypothetical protein